MQANLCAKNKENINKLRNLMQEVRIENWNERKEDALYQFDKEEERFRQIFIEKYNVNPNDDEALLYKICDLLKTKKRIDYEACWASSIADNIITKLSSRGEKAVKNGFYYKRHDALNSLSEREQLIFLIKNRNYWLSEIQEALDTQNYDLLLNSVVLLMTYSSNAMGYYYDDH